MKAETKMRPSEVMDFINELERQFPVEQWSVDGIDLWPMARFRLTMELESRFVIQGQEFQPSPSSSKILQKLIRSNLAFAKSWFSDREHNTTRDHRTDVLFMSDGISFTDIGGKFYEKFCDPMIDSLREQGLNSILLTPQNRGFVPRYSPSIFIQPDLDRTKIIWAMKIFQTSPDRDKCLPGHAEFMQTIRNRFDFETTSLHRIELKGMLIKEFSRYFRKLLRKYKPGLVAVVSYYYMEGYALILACRKLGIRVMDLQHGMQSPLHPAYGRFVKQPEGGFNTLPTDFWCWGKRPAENIDHWAKETGADSRGLPGANLFLELWRSGRGQFVKEYDARIAAASDPSKGTKNILVTLQAPGVNDSVWHLMDTLIKIPGNQYRFWLRAHPGWPEEEQRFESRYSGLSNVEVKLSTRLPLYALLRHMDLHITYGSSTILEAAEFGVASIMLTRSQQEFFPSEIESGMAVCAETEDELGRALEDQLNKKQSLATLQETSSNNLDRACELLYSTIRNSTSNP